MKRDRDQLTIPPDAGAGDEQPKWRQDFPIDWPQDHYISRRDFTKFMVLTSMAFAVGQLWITLQNFLRARRGELPLQKIANVDEVTVGNPVSFAYPDPHDSCLLLRTGAETFTAFSQKCTHLSCAVAPQPEKNCFFCPCHEGSFDLSTGAPIAGPPRRPLPRIKLEVRGGAIYASGVELRTI